MNVAYNTIGLELSKKTQHNVIWFFIGDWNPIDQAGSRADSFEYVMHGRIYRIEGEESIAESAVSIL